MRARAVQPAAARGAGDKAGLDQIGFHHILQRVARFGQAGGERLDADGAALVEVGDHPEIAPILRVEPKAVDLQPGQRIVGKAGVDRGLATGGEIAHTAEQAAGNARGAAGAAGNLPRAIVGQRQAQERGRAGDDAEQLGLGIEDEADGNAEPVAQGLGDEA